MKIEKPIKILLIVSFNGKILKKLIKTVPFNILNCYLVIDEMTLFINWTCKKNRSKWILYRANDYGKRICRIWHFYDYASQNALLQKDTSVTSAIGQYNDKYLIQFV